MIAFTQTNIRKDMNFVYVFFLVQGEIDVQKQRKLFCHH